MTGDSSQNQGRTLERILADWVRLADSPGRTIPWVVALVNLALTLFTYGDTLQRHLNSGDEYAYLVSAQLFARGKLSVPSPPQKEFFDVVHVINDGKFYGKYPPGWPGLLTVGVLVGLPWIVNPLLGMATVFAIDHLARRHFSVRTANIASLALLGNPFLVFNSASLFSHSSCLLFSVLALDALFECVDRPTALGPSIMLGAAAGMAFLIRPFTLAVVLAVPGLYLLSPFWNRSQGKISLLRSLFVAGGSFLIFALLFLAYNRAQTGSPWVQPFQVYASWDAPSLPKNAADFLSRLRTHVLVRLLDLALWLPLSPLFALMALAHPVTRRNPKLVVLFLMFLSLFVAYFFYWGDGVVQYGPRYLFESTGALLVLAAAVIGQFERKGLPMIASILALNVLVFLTTTGVARREIAQRRNVFALIEQKGLSNAIVFLRTGSGTAPVWDCTRNGIDFSGPVLFVRDLGIENRRLLDRYPDRKGYYYDYVASRNQGLLTPIEDRSRP